METKDILALAEIFPSLNKESTWQWLERARQAGIISAKEVMMYLKPY